MGKGYSEGGIMSVSKPAGIIPAGGVVAWLKSYTNTPALPSEYVECNGQTLSDAQSVYNGQTIPDLNTGTSYQRFLRGSTTSGTTGGWPSHSHSLQQGYDLDCGMTYIQYGDTTDFQDHLPPYYEVCWVIRIK